MEKEIENVRVLNLTAASNEFVINETIFLFVGNKTADDFERRYDHIDDNGNSSNRIVDFFKSICNSGTIVIYDCYEGNRGDLIYNAYTNGYSYSLTFDYGNRFATDPKIVRIDADKRYQKDKLRAYHNKKFKIKCRGGIVFIDQKHEKRKVGKGTQDSKLTLEKQKKIQQWLSIAFNNSEKETENWLKPGFRENILEVIDTYNTYERRIEEDSVAAGKNVYYYQRKNVFDKAKNKVYQLLTNEYIAPEAETGFVGNFVEGSRIQFDSVEGLEAVTGTIDTIKQIDDYTAIDVRLFSQCDDKQIPQQGKIYLQPNTTQQTVRERVYKSIRQMNTTSEYMYRTLNNFHTLELDDPEMKYSQLMESEEGVRVSNYIDSINKESGQHLNTMQEEAIRKGLLTKDIQLVLGPPGTGKTTVIVKWIEYFIRQNKRVLISSQNNAAVDNVLERIGDKKGVECIRVGNYNKVQANCQKYLLEEKLDDCKKQVYAYTSESIKKLNGDLVRINNCIDFTKNYYEKLVEYETSREEKDSYIQGKYKSEIGRINEAYKRYNNSAKAYKEYIIKHQDLIYYQNWYENLNFFEKLSQGLIGFLLNNQSKKINHDIDNYKAENASIAQEYNREIAAYNSSLQSDEMLHHLVNRCKLLLQRLDMGTLRYDFFSPLISEQFEPITTSNSSLKEVLPLIHKRIIELADLSNRIGQAISIIKGWVSITMNNHNEALTDIAIEESNVIGATCIGINSNKKFSEVNFDVAILDESGQIQAHNAIVPMSRAPINLLLGDHLQIPPLVNESLAKLCKEDSVSTELLEKSFFEFLFTNFEGLQPKHPNITRLNTQFRFPKIISDILGKQFYENNYEAGRKGYTPKRYVPGFDTTITVIDTSDAQKAQYCHKHNEGGYENKYEADLCVKLIERTLKNLDQSSSDKAPEEIIGVIAPYAKQVQLIRKKLRERMQILSLTSAQINAMVASLDSFQGQERPVIFFSCTRSSDIPSYKRRIGFLKELRRLNVAFSRCQNQLFVIGDMQYLTTCEFEEKDGDEVLPNKSEKKFSNFMKDLIAEVKSNSDGTFAMSNSLRKEVSNGK